MGLDKLTSMMSSGKSTRDELWKQAPLTEIELNTDIDTDSGIPKWSFDCGFKLDFDGSLLTISSRFYPPSSFIETNTDWDGAVTVYLLDKEVHRKTFKCKDLNTLKSEVSVYLEEIKGKLLNIKRD